MMLLKSIQFLVVLAVSREISCVLGYNFYRKLLSEEFSGMRRQLGPVLNTFFNNEASGDDGAKGISASSNPQNFGTFDFIIVGPTSRGSVIAERLSEEGDWKILLLDAGSEEPHMKSSGDYFESVPDVKNFPNFIESNKDLSTEARFPKITVLRGVRVAKLIIDPVQHLVEGVDYIKDGAKFQAFVNKEVILAGGAYNTAQILMLSGIGPKKHLQEMGVDLVKDLPVGEDVIVETSLTLPFILNHTMTLNGETESPLCKIFYNTEDNVLNFKIVLTNPMMRNDLKLQSTDPLDQLHIVPKIDLEDIDKEAMIDGIQHVLKFMRSSDLKEFNPVLKKSSDVCDKFKDFSQEFWMCYIKHNIDTKSVIYGTAKMGDPGVVNHDLGVLGVAKLMVADPSVVPVKMSGDMSAVSKFLVDKLIDVIRNFDNMHK